MHLSASEVQQFYRIWRPLLNYVNERLTIDSHLGQIGAETPLSVQQVLPIRDALWANDAVRDDFIAENPARLSDDDLLIVKGWQHRVAGTFYVFRHLKGYSVFLYDAEPPTRAYGVLGISDSLETNTGPYLPVIVKAVLIPFGDRIIYDSLLHSYNIHLGGGIRGDLNLAYRNAREREGIITSLLPRDATATAPDEQHKGIARRNSTVLKAFEKALFKAGLSPKTVARHVSAIQAFANDYLLTREPPRAAVEIVEPDLDQYLGDIANAGGDERALATSIGRFVRFLFESDRLNPEVAWHIQQRLKDYRRAT